MIIVRGNIVAEKAEAHFVVTKTPAGFVIEVAKTGTSFEFDKTKLEFAPDIAYLTLNTFGVPVLFWQSELGHSRDAYSSIALRKKINMNDLQSAFATFCVDDQNEAHIIVHGDTVVAGDSAIVVSGDVPETACDIFQRLVPGIERFMRHSRAKVGAMAAFNSLDAVAGLEYQVDLLTAVVKALVADMPVDKRPEWWEAFENAVTPNASYNLVSPNKAIEVVESEKVKARQGQVEYFNKLTNG